MTHQQALSQDDMRRLALALPEAIESSHQSGPDFRVRNKIFATLPASKPNITVVKIAPTDLDILVQSDPESFHNAWAGRWIGFDLARVDPDLLHKLLIESWCLVAPKTLVRAYKAGK